MINIKYEPLKMQKIKNMPEEPKDGMVVRKIWRL